jgi:hypothetical protein
MWLRETSECSDVPRSIGLLMRQGVLPPIDGGIIPPSGNIVSGEVRLRVGGLPGHDIAKVVASHVGPGEIGLPEGATREVDIPQVCEREVTIMERGVSEVQPRKIGPSEIHSIQVQVMKSARLWSVGRDDRCSVGLADIHGVGVESQLDRGKKPKTFATLDAGNETHGCILLKAA